jgi:hypothetical protein
LFLDIAMCELGQYVKWGSNAENQGDTDDCDEKEQQEKKDKDKQEEEATGKG